MLYPSQFSVLMALVSADNFRENCPENAELFDNFASSFFNHPNFQKQTEWLVENGLIDEKGYITQKGRVMSSINPSYLSKKELGIRTNQFIFESLRKRTLAKGFQFMDEDTFLEIATLVENELKERYPVQMKDIRSELEQRLQDDAAVEDHVLKLQAPVEVVSEGEVLTEKEYEQKEQKVSTTKKKTKKEKV